MAHNLPSDGPETGYLGFLHQVDRAWPSVKLVVRTFFDYDLWLLLPALAVASIALAFVMRATQLALFASAFLVATLAAGTWTIWATPEFEFTQGQGGSPVVRLDGGAVIVVGALTPLLLERALPRREWTAERVVGLRRFAPWAIVVAAVLAYPGSMAVGYSGFRLPGGAPPFPSAADCVLRPVEGSQVRLVLGYAGSYPDAFAVRDRAEAAGLDGAKIAQDGCGRLRVYVDGFQSVAAAEQVASTVRARHVDVALERDPGD